MKFNYQARTKTGEIQTGVVEASSREAALLLLQKYGFYVTYLEEAKVPFYAKRVEIFQRISRRDIVLFSRQLSMMFSSRVSLVEALRSLASQTKNSVLRETILDISEEVEGGSPFSDALSRHPKIFSQIYVSMVKAGEVSGKLSETLNYLADYLEREYYLASKTKGALIYPALILLVTLLVLILMIFLVIPNLKSVILASGAEIPKSTKLVIALSDFLRKSGLFLIFGSLLFLFLIFRYYKTKEGKNLFDKIFLKLPLIGPLLQLIYLSRFAENLSTLISGGLMIAQALELSAHTIGNSIYQEAILKARDEVRKGIPISSNLSLFPEIFPPVFIQMILVGEKIGALDVSLMNIANFYQREVGREVDSLISILEPVLIIILGVIVGGMMLSVLMPLYQTVAI